MLPWPCAMTDGHRVPQGHLQLSMSMDYVWFHGVLVHLQMPSVLSIPWPQWAMVCVVMSQCCSPFLMCGGGDVPFFLHLFASVIFFLFCPFSFSFHTSSFDDTNPSHPCPCLHYTVHPRPRPTLHLTSWILAHNLSSVSVLLRTHSHTLALPHRQTLFLTLARICP